MSSTTKNSLDDRLDAARAMLGISPCSVIDESVTTIMGGRGGPGNNNNNNNNNSNKSSVLQQEDQKVEEEASVLITTTTTYDDPNSSGRRSRSNSAGLDALAFYATREQEATITSTTMTTTMPSILLEGNSDLDGSDFGRFIGSHNSYHLISSSTSHNNNNNNDDEAATATTTTTATTKVVAPPHPVTSSSDDDSEIMPPPPPRTTYININNNTRMSRRRSVSNPEIMDKWETKRLRLVLPASILEEEIAEATAAILKVKKEKALATTTTTTEGGGSSCNNDDEEDDDEDDESDSSSSSSPPTMVDEDEENLDHDQLLRRARSRLLEDLSIAGGEKGVLTLPHSLKKYKEIYNKNGRIGIYTPGERAAIIARFQKKRKSRMWKKKIRYNCRKNLADRRLRIKGRFVKRSSPSSLSNKNTATTTNATAKEENTGTTTVATATTTDAGTTTSAGAGAIQSIPEETEFIENDENDVEMPDVTDPDAGFCPTDEQPYRRTRRHTIT